MFQFKKLSSKILSAFLLAIILPLLFGHEFFFEQTRVALIAEKTAQLLSVAENKVSNIESFIAERRKAIRAFAKMPTIIEAMKAFDRAYAEGGLMSDSYTLSVNKHGETIEQYLSSFNYYDIFLISAQGDVVFTVAKEADLNTNLISGVYQDTGLAKVYKQASNLLEPSLSGFEYYPPSKEEGFFMATPVFYQKKLVGILAFQLRKEEIFNIISDTKDLGVSGEVIAVKKDKSNALVLAAPIRHDKKATINHLISDQRMDVFEQAIAGHMGTSVYQDYLGHEVLAVWRYLPSFRWGIVAKIDTVEAFKVINTLQKIDYFIQGIVVLFIITVSMLIARTITKPLIRLKTASQLITEGDYSITASIEGDDEIAMLAQSFNLMANELQLKQKNIDKHIAELVDAQQQVNAIVENTAESIVTIDAEGIVCSFNPKSEQIFGYKPNEIIGKNVSTLMPKDERTAHDGYVKHSEIHEARVINNARELFGLRKDGSTFPMELNVAKMNLATKKMFVGIMHDITERKHIEQQLKQSEERFKLSQNFANVGTWEWNIQTGELYWSEQIACLFGYKVGTLITSYDNFIAALHPDDVEMVETAIQNSIDEKIEYNIQHRVVWPDRSIHWLQEKGAVTYDEHGEALLMLGIVSNITQIKQVEAGLREAEKKAIYANNAKSEFLSSMSHELRTPLNAILGFSQLMLSDKENPLVSDQREDINEIIRGGEHLLELVNDILDLAKIESGNIDFSLEPVSVNHLISEVLSMVNPIITKHEVQIDSVCQCEQSDNVMIHTDFLRTKQIMLNLISNAAKYNRKKGSIQIQCNTVSDEMLRITVIDNGYGINKEKQHELFKPFNRLGAENSDIEGTGIGLVVCKELIEKMHGKMGFESEEGKGSSFWFELPLSKQIAEATDCKGDEQEQAFPKLNGTLLYIEDNPANLKLMTALILRTEGLSLISATTAEEGLNIAEDKQPDIIIMDINLPGISGIEAVKRLKNNSKTRHIPVLALSAAATRDDISQSKNVGFERYLTKPMDVQKILNCIYNVLTNKI